MGQVSKIASARIGHGAALWLGPQRQLLESDKASLLAYPLPDSESQRRKLMKAAPAVLKTTIPSLEMKEDELIRVLESSIYPGATLESIKLAIGYCRPNSLDPMQHPVHIVPMSAKNQGHNGQPDRYKQHHGI